MNKILLEEDKEEEVNKSILINDYKLNNGYEDLCDYTYESRMYDYYDYFEE